MKTKVSTATGAVLDWMVAMAMGHTNGFPENLLGVRTKGFGTERIRWQPSTNWSQGGPIIEREKITIYPWLPEPDDASWNAWMTSTHLFKVAGPTPLIAAMRTYVTSKLGDEVDVPEGLI